MCNVWARFDASCLSGILTKQRAAILANGLVVPGTCHLIQLLKHDLLLLVVNSIEICIKSSVIWQFEERTALAQVLSLRVCTCMASNAAVQTFFPVLYWLVTQLF